MSLPKPPAFSPGGKIALAVLAVVVALCLIVAVAAIYFYASRAPAVPTVQPVPVLSATPVISSTLSDPSLSPSTNGTPAAALPATGMPTATLSARASLERDGAWSEDVGQENADDRFADDFSTPAQEWAAVSEDFRAWELADGRYRLRLTRPGFREWAFLPADFVPAWVEFDAAVQPGRSQGGYGALCHFNSEDDFYYATVDAVNASYSIGHHVNGGDTNLMSDWWTKARFLRGSPLAINHVRVECGPESIALYLNGQLEATAPVGPLDPVDPDNPPRAAIFGQTWEDMPAAGLEVVFDNVTAGE